MTIPRQRASAVCVHEGRLLVVYLRDPGSGRTYPFPPGGAIEPGELAEEAAWRETREETGFSVIVDKNRFCDLTYDFEWNGKSFACETRFFAAERGPSPAAAVGDTAFLVKVDWLPIAAIGEAFAFHPGIRDCILKLA